MMRTRLVAAVSLVVLLAGCGDRDAPSAPTASADGTWSRAAMYAMRDGAEPGGVAEIGKEVVIVGKRRLDQWLVVPRDQLVDKARRFEVRRIAPTFNESSWIGGRGPLAARALSIGAMKDLPVEVVGFGVWPDGQFALLDRRQRVLWSGRLLAGPGGGVRAITFDRATVLPGGDHSGLAEADPRDRGPGVRALAVLPEARDGVDVVVLEAAPKPDVPWRLHRLDRTGATVKAPLSFPPVGAHRAAVALAWSEGGYDVLVAPDDPGTLARESLLRMAQRGQGSLAILGEAESLAADRFDAYGKPDVVHPRLAALGRGREGRLYVVGSGSIIQGNAEDPGHRLTIAWR